ncbi:MAG: hypothetical protein ACUVR8_13530 [Acidobacteriota bacterium]
MTTDLTFITNEQNQTLKDRFHVLIKDARFFDVLVGYFFASGFYAIYPALEGTEKIRILVGIGADRQTYDMFAAAREEQRLEFILSHAETKQIVERILSAKQRIRRRIRPRWSGRLTSWCMYGLTEEIALVEEKEGQS